MSEDARSPRVQNDPHAAVTTVLRMDIRTTLALGVAAVVVLSAAGCAKDDSTTATESGAELITEDTLTICTHLPYEPFEFTEDGEVVGFDVDVLEIAADAEGWDTEVVDTSWETIVAGEALNTGQCDVAAGAMTITDERVAVMDFTEPYFEATQALMAKTGSGITSLEDLAGRPSLSRTPPPAPTTCGRTPPRTPRSSPSRTPPSCSRR